MQERFGFLPHETRVYLKIGEGLRPELLDFLRGTTVANDLDGLLVLTRLTFAEQGQLVYYLNEGLLPELAVQLTSTGQLQAMLAV